MNVKQESYLEFYLIQKTCQEFWMHHIIIQTMDKLHF